MQQLEEIINNQVLGVKGVTVMKQSNINPYVGYDILEATVIKSYKIKFLRIFFRNYFSPDHELVDANEFRVTSNLLIMPLECKTSTSTSLLSLL